MIIRPLDLAKNSSSRPRKGNEIAYTLTEVMVASSIFTIVVGAAITVHMMGARMCQITKAKLGASDEARAAISKLIDEVRSAKMVKLGEGNLTSFTEVGVGDLHAGTAIQVYASTNTNFFIRYFWDESDKKLNRTTNGENATHVVAHWITNDVIFTAEDYKGNILTNHQNNRVIGLKLEFYQIAYPIVSVGPGGMFDYYRLSTKITRRVLE